MAGLLDPWEGDGTWVENRPSKWQQTWDIFSPYITAPAYAVKGLMDTPLEVLLGAPGTEAAQDEAVANAFNVAGAVTGGSSVVPKPANALNMGIKAFHGSPHSFDKFSMDKIGTGEGAQAYGHGLYFAENEATAQGYRDALQFPRIDGASTPVERVADDLNYHRGNVEAVTSIYQGMLKNGTPEAKALAQEKLAALPEAVQKFKGSMYEVNIDADPNAFLDWDKPLSEQPEVMGKLPPELRAKIEERAAVQGAPTGANAYAWATPRKDGVMPPWDTAATSQALKEAGIPGIKYLDAGSRGAGDGTRNYVVFDDNLIEIIRKYGIAGLLGSSAAYGAMSGQPQEDY